AWVALKRKNPEAAARRCLAVTALTLLCAVAAWLRFHFVGPRASGEAGAARLLELDELSAPLLAMMALLHFLVVLATPRGKMPRISFVWLRLAAFACRAPWPLVALLAAGTVPPYAELLQRRRPTRLYGIYALLFVVLLV